MNENGSWQRTLLGRAAVFVATGATSFLMELKALALAVKTLRQFLDELILAQQRCH